MALELKSSEILTQYLEKRIRRELKLFDDDVLTHYQVIRDEQNLQKIYAQPLNAPHYENRFPLGPCQQRIL